jgi:acetolactate synthase small subunit
MNITYISIISNNSIWVINRISNLLRRKKYNIEALKVDFDNKWFWHIIVWIDLKQNEEINQVINQLNKLYDIKEVSLYDK